MHRNWRSLPTESPSFLCLVCRQKTPTMICVCHTLLCINHIPPKWTVYHSSNTALYWSVVLPSQLRKIIQCHQIMCGLEICIQSVTYKESLNHSCKRRLRYINNNKTLLTRGSAEKFNAENTASVYSDFVLPDGKPIYLRSKDASFFIMFNFLDKDIKLPKWSCVLNCCSGCPVFSYA